MNLKHGSNAVKIRAMIIVIVLQLVFGDYSVAHATTKLIFRAQTGVVFGVNIPVGKEVSFNSIDVSPYRKIRIIASERAGSASRVNVKFIMMEGADSLGELEPVTVSPGSSQTKVFDVPGTRLGIIADAQAGVSGSDVIEILIYGSD